jgi:pyroglutamyl-peptidase
VLHVGVAGYGSLQLEELGHKFGYYGEDADGQLAPTISSRLTTDISTSKADTRYEVEHTEVKSPPSQYPGNNIGGVPIHGFAEGYESFPEELSTSLDLQNLMQLVKLSGIEVRLSFSLPLKDTR